MAWFVCPVFLKPYHMEGGRGGSWLWRWLRSRFDGSFLSNELEEHHSVEIQAAEGSLKRARALLSPMPVVVHKGCEMTELSFFYPVIDSERVDEPEPLE
ncbi:hypothetical protein EYF80_010119 [Liparis tanakae]|uniref:Uncharacterized protein n=1 Tax=Liparis tanakae TaxID=230148 RepID=A0A4Z2IP19_9TELE|nr:hypothetical protein EYF80_010119 [Liparis tanakae]